MPIDLDQAIARVTLINGLKRHETVPLAKAAGRTLAEPIHARIEIPQRSLSAVDGFAVRDTDIAGGTVTLVVAGTSFPGGPTPPDLSPSMTLRVATGAPTPKNATRVIMREDCQDNGDNVIVAQLSGEARHIRTRGEECRVNDRLLPEGTLVSPRHIVAIAAADVARVAVVVPPRIAILAIGDELTPPSYAEQDAGRTPDSLSPGLAALVAAWGGTPTCHAPLSDDRARIRDAVRSAASEYDAILLVGAASNGERDHAFAAAQDAGAEPDFRGIAMKPGKPAWSGRIGDVPILGLPGNPTAAMVVARLLAAPLLCSLLGRDWRYAAIWKREYVAPPKAAPLHIELIARAKRCENGEFYVLDGQKASAQRSLSDADLLVRWRRGPGPSIESLVMEF